jgi:hypothetical protein
MQPQGVACYPHFGMPRTGPAPGCWAHAWRTVPGQGGAGGPAAAVCPRRWAVGGAEVSRRCAALRWLIWGARGCRGRARPRLRAMVRAIVVGTCRSRRGDARRFRARDACGDRVYTVHAVASRCSQHGTAIGTHPVRAATKRFSVSRAPCSRCALPSAFFAL